jgi:hypothetical protein
MLFHGRPGQPGSLRALWYHTAAGGSAVHSNNPESKSVGMNMTTINETPLTEEYLRDVQHRLKLAAAGPWTSFVEGRDHTSGSSFIRTATTDIELSGATAFDQDFIAHARYDVQMLLAEVHRLRKAK